MPKPTPYTFRLIYLLVFVFVFIVGFPILIFYSTGYTWDEALGLSVRGGVYVFLPQPNTSVFLGNELKGTSSFFNRELLINHVKPDHYLVLVANEQFWPWAKFVDVRGQEVEALAPFLVPKVIDAEEIKPTDAQHKTVSGLFLAKSENTISTSTPEILESGKVRIWLSGQHDIIAEWTDSNESAPKYFCGSTQNVSSQTSTQKNCTSPIEVFHSDVSIRRIDFYPSHDDAIVLALDNGIYAVEIDNRQYQNFYPIYKGKQPDFRVSKNQMYIQDGTYLALLHLDI